MERTTVDADYPAGPPGEAVAARPSVKDAAQAVDADDWARVLSLRAGLINVVLLRGHYNGRSMVDAADMGDYQSMLRVLERAGR